MRRNHSHTFKVIAFISLLALINLLCSCGARKAEKTRSNEETKTELIDQSKMAQSEVAEIKAETNIKKSEHITVNDQDQTTTIKETIEPLDPTKPASYTDKDGTKKDLNNAKKTTESTTKKNNTSTKKDSETKVQGKSEAKAKNDTSFKNDIVAKAAAKKETEKIIVDREAWSNWNLLWLLIPAAALYYVWKNRIAIGKKIAGIW